ncbi:hypothetical protein YC2023_007112 [Brassica napus]
MTNHHKNARLWSSKAWTSRLSSFSSYFLRFRNLGSRLSSFSSYFLRFRNLGSLCNHTKALCLSAAAGHAPMEMAQIELYDITAVELVDSLPLVRRADPHNLHFFDGAFDFAFTAHLDDALFPWRVVEGMERAVRRGRFCVVAVDECGGDDVREIARLFLKSKLVDVANVTLEGSKKTSILLKVQDFKT